MSKDVHYGETDLRLEVSLIDGELVILNLDNGYYYAVTGVGVQVWQLIDQGATRQAVIDGVVARYGLDPEVAEEEIGALLEKFVVEGLRLPGEPAPASDPAIVDGFEGWAEAYAPVSVSKYNDLLSSFALDPPLVVGKG